MLKNELLDVKKLVDTAENGLLQVPKIWKSKYTTHALQAPPADVAVGSAQATDATKAATKASLEHISAELN